MQRVAAEMNHSATAFLVPVGQTILSVPQAWSLRWFTPAVEVDLCGHATLASAHALWTEGLLPEHETAKFDTRSGRLTAARNGELIELDFPATPVEPATVPTSLLESLGVSASFVGRNAFDYFVEVDSEETVRRLAPDHARLRTIPVRGVIVTARSTNRDYDFVSRFFAPASGIDEDPVTGSAHCALAPYWARKLGKTELVGYQASPRGGFVRVRVDGDRVKLGGRAVTVLRGELVV